MVVVMTVMEEAVWVEGGSSTAIVAGGPSQLMLVVSVVLVDSITTASSTTLRRWEEECVDDIAAAAASRDDRETAVPSSAAEEEGGALVLNGTRVADSGAAAWLADTASVWRWDTVSCVVIVIWCTSVDEGDKAAGKEGCEAEEATTEEEEAKEVEIEEGIRPLSTSAFW